jgi:hypothetical protein
LKGCRWKLLRKRFEKFFKRAFATFDLARVNVTMPCYPNTDGQEAIVFIHFDIPE